MNRTQYTCDRCGAQYTSAIAMIWCCDEAAWGDDDELPRISRGYD